LKIQKLSRCPHQISLERAPSCESWLKEIKKRWGKGQEDALPVAQIEKLWGDMTSLPELSCGFVAVRRLRGQQLKETPRLDGWLRDGPAAHVESLCNWAD
jgi:hypothetical protein